MVKYLSNKTLKDSCVVDLAVRLVTLDVLNVIRAFSVDVCVRQSCTGGWLRPLGTVRYASDCAYVS